MRVSQDRDLLDCWWGGCPEGGTPPLDDLNLWIKTLKTFKNLYPQIYTFGNLYWAYRTARLGKWKQEFAASFEYDLEHNLLTLQKVLQNKIYHPGPYHNFYINESKRRLVSAASSSAEGMRLVLGQIWL